MKKKRRKLNLAEKIRRDSEIKQYGRILSLRPSIVHKSKKQYTRKTKHKDDYTK